MRQRKKGGKNNMSDELPFRTNLILLKDIKALYVIGHREYPNSIFFIDEGDVSYPIIGPDPQKLWDGVRSGFEEDEGDKMLCFSIYNFKREIIRHGIKDIRGSGSKSKKWDSWQGE